MIEVRCLVNGECQVTDGIEAMTATKTVEARWIRVVAPTKDEEKALIDQLGLHELAIRDALREGLPPKMQDFGNHIFMILNTPMTAGESRVRKIAMFLGKTFVVTLQRVEIGTLDALAARIDKDPKHTLASPCSVAHVVLDHMMDGFEQMADRMNLEITRLEDRVMRDVSPEVMREIIRLRRQLGWLQRLTRSQRDVCMSLSRVPHEVVDEAILPYLRDVYDHVLRIYEMLDAGRDGLTAARDAHLSVVNNRLSEIMRTLTIIATIMMPLSLLAGIYGMNMKGIPGVESDVGAFWIMIGLMGIVAFVMLRSFRKRGWF